MELQRWTLHLVQSYEVSFIHITYFLSFSSRSFDSFDDYLKTKKKMI